MIIPPSAPAFIIPNSYSNSSLSTNGATSTIVSSGTNTKGIWISGGTMMISFRNSNPDFIPPVGGAKQIPPHMVPAGVALTMKLYTQANSAVLPYASSGYAVHGTGELCEGSNVVNFVHEAYDAYLNPSNINVNFVWTLNYRVL